MGKTFSEITDGLAGFMARQQMFFVASAPLSGEGHINLSPKGLDSFRVLDPRTVAYLDLTGSGVETIAHVKENQRLVIMFCAFEGPPKIVRLHGRAEVLEPGHPEFAALASRFPPRRAVRAIIRLGVERIADSCGYGIPIYEYREQRSTLLDWAEHKDEQTIATYQQQKNAVSIDGLPGVKPRV
jgi:hypothetical protein